MKSWRTGLSCISGMQCFLFSVVLRGALGPRVWFPLWALQHYLFDLQVVEISNWLRCPFSPSLPFLSPPVSWAASAFYAFTGERAQQNLYQNTGDIFDEEPHSTLSSSQGLEIVAIALLKAKSNSQIHILYEQIWQLWKKLLQMFKYMYFDRGRLFYMWWTWPDLEQYLK